VNLKTLFPNQNLSENLIAKMRIKEEEGEKLEEDEKQDRKEEGDLNMVIALHYLFFLENLDKPIFFLKSFF